MTHSAWPALTERLTIRPCTVDDIDALWEWRRRPEVNHWLGSAPQTLDAFRERLSDPDRLATMHVIELRAAPGAAPTPIGDIMVRTSDAWGQAEVLDQVKGVVAEIGWALHPDYSGQGYATEAVRAVMDVCFTRLGFRRVYAACFAANEPSWRLMERLGMRREEYNRKGGLHRSGEWMDGMIYALLAEEWPVVEGA